MKLFDDVGDTGRKVQRDWRNDPEPPEQQQQPDDQQDEQQNGDGGDCQQGQSEQEDSQQGETQQGDPQQGDSSDSAETGQESVGDMDMDGSEESSGSDSQPQQGGARDARNAQQAASESETISQEEAERRRQEMGAQEAGSDDSANDSRSSISEEEKERRRQKRKEQAREFNDDAFGTSDESDDSDTNWGQMRRERVNAGINKGTSGDDAPGAPDFYTKHRMKHRPSVQVEKGIQQFRYEINEDAVSTDWTPEKLEDHRIAQAFAIIVSKLADDLSYREIEGDEFWDAKALMKRTIDGRPLHHCKKDYNQRRLALLVDTSPSCRDEAIFYSKIASGAMLRNDIDIFLAPNGQIDGEFSREHNRFLISDKGKEWDLDGRTILYFTDWDGSTNIAHQSKKTNLYWFDNCPPSGYWNNDEERYQNTRKKFRGTHYHCPDKSKFKDIARKIRP